MSATAMTSPAVGRTPREADQRGHRLAPTAARVVAGCLVLPAIGNVVYHLFTPVTSGTTSVAVAQAVAHPHLAYLVLLQFGFPVLGLGAAALAWRAAAVTPRLAGAAGAFLAGGYLLGGGPVDGVIEAVAPRFIGQAATVRLVDGYDGSLPGRLGELLTLGGQAPGIILMAIVLWRSRIVPRWLAVAFGATLPLHVLTHLGNGERPPAASWGWYTLVLAGCGWALVRDARSADSSVTSHG